MFNLLRTKLPIPRNLNPSIGLRGCGALRQATRRNGRAIEISLNGHVGDSSGAGASVSSTNLSFAASDVGYSAQYGSFNGSSSYVSYPNVATGTAYTIGFRTKSNSTHVGCVVSDNNGSSDVASYEFFNNNGVFWFRVFRTGDTSGTAPTISGGTFANSIWYDVKLVAQSGGQQVIYVNGDVVASGNLTGNNLADQATSGAVGRRGGYSQFYYNGAVQDFFIDNRPWTQQEAIDSTSEMLKNFH